MPRVQCFIFICLLALCASRASAEPLTLPSILSDHMVLQRGVAAPIWGRADAGAEVHVAFGGTEHHTNADSNGSWMLRVGPFDAAAQPADMIVSSGGATLTIRDVLVGDVWIAAGQSNMEMTLRQSDNAADAIARADDPSLRMFVVRRRSAAEPQFTCEGRWVVCSPQTAGALSAVGYYFASEIRKHQNVPVGMVGTYAGGTKIEAWTSVDAFLHDPLLDEYARRIQTSIETLEQRKREYEEMVFPQWQQRHDEWEREVGVTYRPQLREWNEQAAAARAAGQAVPPKPRPARAEPKRPDAPTVYSRRLSGLYNAMVAPLKPLAIKGFLWYQGESNADDPQRYRALFPAMIADWREQFQQGELPFLFVQLPNFQSYPDADWPGLREAQAAALESIPNTAMAVTIDVGSDRDIHPKRKIDVAHRLSLAARRLAYGEAVEFQSPTVASVKIEGHAAQVTFKHVGDGLQARRPTTLPAEADGTITAFALAGADGVFHDADARLVGRDSVTVTCPDVPRPAYVRYAWANTPRVNLYNSAGLPAKPFRSDKLSPRSPTTGPAGAE